MFVIYINVNIRWYLHPYKSANMTAEGVLVDVKVVGEGLGKVVGEGQGVGDTNGSVEEEVRTPDSGYSSVSSHSSRLSFLTLQKFII